MVSVRFKKFALISKVSSFAFILFVGPVSLKANEYISECSDYARSADPCDGIRRLLRDLRVRQMQLDAKLVSAEEKLAYVDSERERLIEELSNPNPDGSAKSDEEISALLQQIIQLYEYKMLLASQIGKIIADIVKNNKLIEDGKIALSECEKDHPPIIISCVTRDDG